MIKADSDFLLTYILFLKLKNSKIPTGPIFIHKIMESKQQVRSPLN